MSQYYTSKAVNARSPGIELVGQRCRDYAVALLAVTDENLSPCCEDHRLKSRQATMLTNGFMQILGQVCALTGPIEDEALTRSLLAISDAVEEFAVRIPGRSQMS